MIEIGSALQEARARHGVSIAEAEKETKLRERYLRALEDERFDQLPPGSYRRSFLRTYATFLGLDADLLIAEYIARFEPREEVAAAPAAPVRARRRPGPRVPRTALVLVVVAAVVAAALVGIPRLGRGQQPAAKRTGVAGLSTTHVRQARPHRTHVQAPRRAPATVALELRARGGPAWVSIRRDSAQGPLVYEATLQPGQSVSLHGARFWARLGAPWNLALSIDGKSRPLPQAVADVTLDARGVTGAP